MKPDDRARLARAWLEIQRNWWASSGLNKLIDGEPRVAFAILGTLIELADNEELLGDVGAGPLEDFLRKHAAVFVDEIERRAAADSRWRAALKAVWLPAAEDVTTARLERLGCTLLSTPNEPK